MSERLKAHLKKEEDERKQVEFEAAVQERITWYHLNYRKKGPLIACGCPICLEALDRLHYHKFKDIETLKLKLTTGESVKITIRACQIPKCNYRVAYPLTNIDKALLLGTPKTLEKLYSLDLVNFKY